MPRTSSRLNPRGQQAGIQTFARATKPGATAASTKLQDGKTTPAAAAVTAAAPPLSASPSKKRKLTELENVAGGGGGAGTGTGAGAEKEDLGDVAATPSKTLRFNELSVSSPRSGGHYVSQSPSVRSPLRSRVSVAEKENVAPETPSKRSRSVKGRTTTTSTIPRSQSQSTSTSISRPPVFNELLRLHSSFLKALTLHSAHNGITAGADLREFLRSIERLWKKRKVVVKDLQRLVWIWDQSQPQQDTTTTPRFRLANYGLGRVCLERVIREDERSGRVNEAEWQEQFEQTLDLFWEKTLDSTPAEDKDEREDQVAARFVEMLGVSPVHESLTPFTSFRKGQQRLQDLKGGVIRMKTERLRADSKDDSADSAPKEATTNRRQGLLDRIKNKGLRQSTLPPPPSKEMLLRRAAVDRMEDVASVLASLRPAGYVGSGIKAMLAAQRKPFQIPTVVQHVQDSVRNPVSQKEVEICIDVMARADVAGHWVNYVAVNQTKMVVLKSCADVSPKEIAGKACQMRIGYDDEVVPPSKENTN